MKSKSSVLFFSVIAALATMEPLAGAASSAIELAGRHNGIRVSLDEKNGEYRISCKDRGWKFAGKLPSACRDTSRNQGTDSIGAYHQASFHWQDGQLPMSGFIRLYDEKPLVLFSGTCGQATRHPPSPFPDFRKLPGHLHVFSYRPVEFAPPSFRASAGGSPWLLFDNNANALVISPASHFMVASLFGDGHRRLASGFNTNLCDLPDGFCQQTLLAASKGINRTWDLWGRSLNELRGAQRPANEADTLLKYLGYWTDNGASYYYNYDPALGCAGTLREVVTRFHAEHIPLRYLQLDSWWYYKTFTSPRGKTGSTKNPRLPAGPWNRYGGLMEYQAVPFLFPHGLAAFQKSIGLPLATHNRWIDPASPYHQKYRISGLAAVDPKWWAHITDYLKSSGVVTYEQDWLNYIYNQSPQFSSTAGTAETFLDEMARACQQRGITMQYCMALPRYFLQGASYSNLTTIRVSGDRFNRKKWNAFLYTSRLARSLGIWPWSDVFLSSETNNLLLATLSAGPVGIGDALGQENRVSLTQSVRADGVIVKPDVPCVPLDRCYITDARRRDDPLAAGTWTDHAGLRTGYVFAFNRNRKAARTARFSPADLGLHGEVYVYDAFAGTGVRLKAGRLFKVKLPPNGTGFYELAPIGPSGIAFLGDRGKFVSTGKQRIPKFDDQKNGLTVEVELALAEKSVALHGFAKMRPRVNVRNGTAGPVQFDPATHHFSVTVLANPSAPIAGISPARKLTVQFRCSK